MSNLKAMSAVRPGNERISKTMQALISKPTTLISGFLLILIVASAVFAPLIAPTNPYDLSTVSILDGRLEPGEEMFDGTIAWLGTDGAGRDVLSSILYGLRTSLTVAISSALVALAIGLSVWLTSAFYGGRIDAF